MDTLAAVYPSFPRRQPVKALWLFCKVTSLLVFHLPIWSVKFLFVSWRPRPSFTFSRSLMPAILRHISAAFEQTGGMPHPTHRAIEPGPGVDAEWIQPVPELVSPLFTALARAADVEPATIPGYWYARSETPPAPGEKVLYALHGGGYYQGSAHPSNALARTYTQLLTALPRGTRMLALEYRLAKAHPDPPANAFPCALLDALAGYAHLVRSGFAPRDIIVAGDSAGAHLALSLVRYLTDHAGTVGGLPALPGALTLLWPWCDASTSHERPGSSAYTNYASDILPPVAARLAHVPYGLRALTGPFGLGAGEMNPYFSPASRWCPATFEGYPRTFICAGDGEQLLDSIRELARRLRRDNGEKVTYFEVPDGLHDSLVFEWAEPGNGLLLKAVKEWSEGL